VARARFSKEELAKKQELLEQKAKSLEKEWTARMQSCDTGTLISDESGTRGRDGYKGKQNFGQRLIGKLRRPLSRVSEREE
jgi:hypothetical protein